MRKKVLLLFCTVNKLPACDPWVKSGLLSTKPCGRVRAEHLRLSISDCNDVMSDRILSHPAFHGSRDGTG